MTEYSETKLSKKLGIKPGNSIYIFNPPENYFELLGELPSDIIFLNKIKSNTDFIHFFTKEKSELEKNLYNLKKNLSKNGILWVSWPKKASKVITYLSDSIVRETGLREGLVDIKVCSIDKIWSGLKFVYRLKDR